VGSFLTGSLFSPAFLLGLSGGLASAFAMAAADAIGPRAFSVVGISLVGSVTHVVAQLAVVTALFVKNETIFVLLPLLLTSACAGGLIVAWLSSRMIRIMESHETIRPS
jgi:heptaprenyl diphosphate synthase